MRNDRLLVLPQNRHCGLDNVVAFSGARISMDFRPEELVFMS
jgi:hypothetical protein